MGAVSKISRVLGISAMLALLITCSALVFTHQDPTCQYSTGGGDWNECTKQYRLICNAPAIEIEASMKVFGVMAEFDLHCPWRVGTFFMSSIALLLSFAFMILFAFSGKVKSFRLPTFFLVAGINAIAFLLASIVMMVIDIIMGFRSMPNDYKIIGFKYVKHQSVFMVNALLMLLAVLSLGFLTRYAYKTCSAKVRTALLDDLPPYERFYHRA